MSDEYLNPPRGMRDIVGKEANIYEYVMQRFREIARSRGFEPIITPTVEYSKLFEAKSGEEIKKSMYVFEDKAGRLVVLRPEVTASVVRAYLKHMRGESKPIRLYYISQCFRYEEPQYARYREFWQGGLEIIGDPDVNADVSVAYTASSFLDDIGVKHYYVVGNVAIYRAFMKNIGISEETQDHILHLIDKDMINKAIETFAAINSEYMDLFKDMVNLELDRLDSFINDTKKILGNDYERVVSEYNRLTEFISTLRELGYDAKYSPRLVRGLAYYTGLIFEYKVPGVFEVSIGGGGRYDGLSLVYKGEFEYFTGLALGLDRVILALEKDLSELSKPSLKVLIALIGNVPLSVGYRLTRKLESIGNNVSSYVYRHRSLSRILEYANKKGFDKVLIVGEREHRDNKVLIKDMRTGHQLRVDPGDLPRYIRDK